MYAEFNDSIDPNREWEFSVEFSPEELSEYEFYLYAEQGKIPLCSKVPRKIQGTRSKAQGSRKHVHKRVLQSTSNKASSRKCHNGQQR